jgi:hypothetical protein
VFFVFVYDCTMPTTRGQDKLGAAGGSDHEDNSDEAPGGGEESPASLATVLAAIAGIQQKLEQHDARFGAMEQTSGWAVREGGAASGGPRATCQLPGCSRGVFVEGDREHDYCSRTHAREHGALPPVDEATSDEEAGGDACEAGVDPDRRAVQRYASSFDVGPPATTRVANLLGTSKFRLYMDDLHRSDPDRAALAEDLLAMHEHLQLVLGDVRDQRCRLQLAPLRQRLERILDAYVVFPGVSGGAKAHKFVHVARRAFAEQEEENLFFGEGARTLAGERSRKEFEQCCATLRKLSLEGDKDKDASPRGSRGGRKKRQQQPQQQQQQPSRSQQQQQSSPQPRQRQPSPDPRRPSRGRSNSRSRGGSNSGAAGGAAPQP